jgi:hypothetical protein
MGIKVPAELEAEILRRCGLAAPVPTEENAAQSEKEFMEAVIKRAKELAWKVYHTRDSRKSEAGFPDLVLLRGPSIVVAELKKSEDEEPTPAQRNWLEAFSEAGIAAYCWRPTDWPEIERVLSASPPGDSPRE